MNRTHSLWRERLCQNFSRNKGFATLWYMVAIVLIIFLASFVVSEGFANVQQGKVKTAMNRAVKAATLQYDMKIISDKAEIVIPKNDAKQAFKEYLTANLKLDNALEPVKGSVFKKSFHIVEFNVIDRQSLPHTVNNTAIQFNHTFQQPGVFAVVKTTLTDVWGKGETTYYVPAVAEIDLDVQKGGGG